MNDTFAAPPLASITLTLVAQAYGTDNYGSNSYNGTTTTPTPTPEPTTTTGPATPLTGYFAEPPIVTFPLLFAVAIIVGSITFIISRRLRQRRK